MVQPIDVACFGELLWDLFEVDAPEGAGGAAQFRRELGGASANVACVLARLGIGASVVGGVGEDAFGEALVRGLDRDGVDVRFVAKTAGRTGITFVFRDGAGEPTFLPYRMGTADALLSASDVAAAAGKARFGVVGSVSMLERTRSATEKFLAALDKAKGALVFDVNARAHLFPDAASFRAACEALAPRAAVVKASDRDLTAIAGKRGMSWLEEHAKDATWLLTRGAGGVAAVGPHGQVTAPTKRVRCVDATGAGDAFLAGVLAVLVRAEVKPSSRAWRDPKDWARALELGQRLGAKAVSSIGAVSGVRELDDLRARLEAPEPEVPPPRPRRAR